MSHRLLQLLSDLAGTTLLLVLLPLVWIALVVTSTVAGWARRQPPAGPLAEAPARISPRSNRPPASVVIPNWNGRELLEKYLPSVIGACDLALGDEVIVVDNASEDGSSALIKSRFPQVRLVQLSRNLGFGGGSNRGIAAATNEYVVLLNSDMRVEPDFLPPLLAPFSDPSVFAVAAQILFSDTARRREESGLTQASWRNGQIAIGHDLQSDVSVVYPCFYPGGGSSAFHREKLLSLGGFDHLYRPFYFEDTDLGFEAWKRGWKVLYSSASVVYHEHRGTIGKRFTPHYVDTIVAKNRILFHWKHVAHPADLVSYCLALAADCVLGIVDQQRRRTSTGSAAVWALFQLPELLKKRWNSGRHAVRSDRTALSLHRPDIYHDQLVHTYTAGSRLQILFVSPYPIYPPHHGGAVLMTHTLRHLAEHCDVHVVVLLEDESERALHLAEASPFASMHVLVRPAPDGSNRFGVLPKAVREFASAELRSLLSRLVLEKSIDVVQLEYTQLAQYGRPYRSVLSAVFEHDVYFQSVGRQLRTAANHGNLTTYLEYLRALRYELNAISKSDYIQVCTRDNADHLLSYAPQLAPRIDPELRAGIDVASYPYSPNGRVPGTLLFIGNFRHLPNQEGLHWLLERVMPLVRREHPEARLRLVGPNQHLLGLDRRADEWIETLGSVEDIRPHLRECTAFVCPVLSGSGVRVKLLEAFASGIPVIATPVGAEGLLHSGRPVCGIAITPEQFAAKIVDLLGDADSSAEMAKAARALVEADWDVRKNTSSLVARYHELLARKAARAPRARQATWSRRP